MKLKQIIEEGLRIKRSQVIGHPITVEGKDALILGLQTSGDLDALLDEEEEQPEDMTVLYLLYQEDETEDDDDEDWEDDLDQEETNRDLLMDELEEDDENPVTSIGTFLIGGKRFDTEGMDSDVVDSPFWKSGEMLRQAAEAGRIPEDWLEEDPEYLWICGYRVSPSMYDVDWDDAGLSIETELECTETVYVGEKFLCECRELETPRVFMIPGPDGGDIMVKIYGMKAVDLGPVDEDLRDLIPEGCDRMLVLKYQAPEGMQMNFYSTAYLERDAEDGAAFWGISGLDSEESDMQYCMIDFVPEGFAETVELELFSYTIEED